MFNNEWKKDKDQANDQQLEGNIKAHVEGIGTVRNDATLTSSLASNLHLEEMIVWLFFVFIGVVGGNTGTGAGTFHAVIVVIVILAIEQNGRAARRHG
jgi:hypothetical protein